MCMERRKFSQTMASEWQTAFVVSHKMPWCALLTAVKNYNKSLEKLLDFFCQDRDQDQDQMFKTKTFIFVLEAPRDQDPALEDYITGNPYYWSVLSHVSRKHAKNQVVRVQKLRTDTHADVPAESPKFVLLLVYAMLLISRLAVNNPLWRGHSTRNKSVKQKIKFVMLTIVARFHRRWRNRRNWTSLC